jgi:hypothetical protein
VTLYQRAGEELLAASSGNDQLRDKVMVAFSDRLSPERRTSLDQQIRANKTSDVLASITPADSFYLTVEFRQKYPGQLEQASTSGRELETLMRQDPNDVSWEKLSRDFGVIHPIFVQSYAREFINVQPFPALEGSYNRLMGECWDSGNLYWARLLDEMGYSPVVMNRVVPRLTRRMVERIAASDLEDWPAMLRALRETGQEFRQQKISSLTGNQATPN